MLGAGAEDVDQLAEVAGAEIFLDLAEHVIPDDVEVLLFVAALERGQKFMVQRVAFAVGQVGQGKAAHGDH